jgi:hypothetical protein
MGERELDVTNADAERASYPEVSDDVWEAFKAFQSEAHACGTSIEYNDENLPCHTQDCGFFARSLLDVVEPPGFDHNDALQVICRAFDNWEPMYDEWLDWYKPTDWIHMSRGFGAFMREKIAARTRDDHIRDLEASLAARYAYIGKLSLENAELRRCVRRGDYDAMAELDRARSFPVAALKIPASERDSDGSAKRRDPKGLDGDSHACAVPSGNRPDSPVALQEGDAGT